MESNIGWEIHKLCLKEFRESRTKRTQDYIISESEKEPRRFEEFSKLVQLVLHQE